MWNKRIDKVVGSNSNANYSDISQSSRPEFNISHFQEDDSDFKKPKIIKLLLIHIRVDIYTFVHLFRHLLQEFRTNTNMCLTWPKPPDQPLEYTEVYFAAVATS